MNPHFELRLLGDFSLRCSDRSPEIVPISAKKARAILAYVAMQEPMQVRRERLATLLWPDRVDRQARQNLRACLASLRDDLADLADTLLLIGTETVEIKSDLTVDARRLRQLSPEKAAGTDAAALYRGQFLADLEVESDAFRDWAMAERAAIDGHAGTILSALAEQTSQSGDAAKANEYSARLTAIDPFREDWLRLRLRITARYLGRGQALAQARDFVALLKKELDVAPEAETAALIERIRATPVTSVQSQVDASVATTAADADAKSAPSRWFEASLTELRRPLSVLRRGHTMTAAFAAAALTALFVIYEPAIRTELSRNGGTAADSSAIPLDVSPFASQAADTSGLAGVLTESVLASVSRFSGLAVSDRRGAQNAQSESAGSHVTPRFSVWGSVLREDAIIRVRVGLTDTANQTVAWVGNYQTDEPTGPAADQLPRRIARDLQVQATYAAARGSDDARTSPAPLYQFIAKALTLQYRSPTLDGQAAALSLYREALRRDPNSALALIGLAAGLVTSSANLQSEQSAALRQAEPLLERAIAIDPWIERAYYWRGIIYIERGQRDLALQSFARTLELNPSFLPAEAHAGFALVLLRHPEAGLGRIENALQQSAHDPNQRLWLRFAAIAQLELGNDQQAVNSLLAAASLASPAPPLRAALASAYALMGERMESREQLRLLEETADPVALNRLLKAAAKSDRRQGSRYLQGLYLAAGDIL